MATAALVERLASIIHDLWRESLADDGWTYSGTFSEEARTHDALVPFASLAPLDRRDMIELAQTWADTLVAEVEYQRGDDREFAASELVQGMPVGWSDRVRSGSGDSTSDDAALDFSSYGGSSLGGSLLGDASLDTRSLADTPVDDPDDEIGHIAGWTISEDGTTLETIRVVWPDGCITEHFPIMRELRRIV